MKTKYIIISISFFTITLLLFASSFSITSLVNQTIHEKNLIIIDPGHGGSDPGKVGYNDILEKNINLQIAKKLAKKLKKNKFHVKLTRNGDYNLSSNGENEKRSDLSKRKQMILDEEPLLVISIHQNSYPRSEVKGAQVFYLSGFEKSKNLATFIQNSLKENVDAKNHRMSKSNTDYYLLRDNPYPTVIVECGFLSNQEECGLLSNPHYQTKVVSAIFKGIQNYISSK